MRRPTLKLGEEQSEAYSEGFERGGARRVTARRAVAGGDVVPRGRGVPFPLGKKIFKIITSEEAFLDHFRRHFTNLGHRSPEKGEAPPPSAGTKGGARPRASP